MARSKRLRLASGQQEPVAGGEENADGTNTLAVQSEYMTGTATIAAGQSLSGEIDTGGRRLAGIVMPAAWTAAVITFQAAAVPTAQGGTYRDLYDDAGNEVTIQAAAGRSIGLDALAYALAPFRNLKVRSGPTAGAIAQVAQADLGLILKG